MTGPSREVRFVSLKGRFSAVPKAFCSQRGF